MGLTRFRREWMPNSSAPFQAKLNIWLHPSTWWRGEDSNLRRLSQQIYSLPPLAAREPLPKDKARIVLIGMGIVNRKTAQIVEKRAVFKRAGNLAEFASDTAAGEFLVDYTPAGCLDELSKLVQWQRTADQVALGDVATGMLQES